MNALVQSQKPFQIVPTTITEAINYAEMIANSSLVPKQYEGKPADVLIAMQMGAELGLTPIQSVQNVAVINGKPSVYGDALMALVRKSGKLEYCKETQTDTEAVCVIKRKGEPEATYTFTRREAEQANLIGRSPVWKAYPKRMMQMRARGFALRDLFADVLNGIWVREEAQDIQLEEKDMGNVEVVNAPTPTVEPKKAKGGVENLKAQLGIKPSLSSILEEIENAQTMNDLNNAAVKASELENEQDKETARKAWAARREYVKLPEVEMPIETTEIINDVDINEVIDVPQDMQMQDMQMVEAEAVEVEAQSKGIQIEKVEHNDGLDEDATPFEPVYEDQKPKLSYAVVLDMINKARSANQLSIAMDAIKQVEHERLQKELQEIASKKATKYKR